MNTIRYRFDKDIPIVANADVVVIGGGPGGLGAAVTAARQGADTLLIERYGFLGGMAVSGEVHPFMPNHCDGKLLDRPVYLDWIKRMNQYICEEHPDFPTADDNAYSHSSRHISKDHCLLAMEDLVLESGAKLLYHHSLVDTIVEDNKIVAAVLHSKSGLVAVTGKVFIDSTGDGDLAVLSGCEYEQGGPSGHCQPMTLCFKLAGVDKAKLPERPDIQRLYEQAQANGELAGNPREDVLMFKWIENDVMHFNSTRVIHESGTDGAALSRAEIAAHQQVRALMRFMRNNIAGFENARLYSIATHIGVRETRRIKGMAWADKSAFIEKRRYPDAIVRCNYMIDIHNPDGTGTEHMRLEPNEFYELPYGCIVAKDVENLLIGCRAISVDHALHSSIRVMPPVCSLGQAAGMAGSLAVKNNTTPQKLDGHDVHDALIAFGAALE